MKHWLLVTVALYAAFLAESALLPWIIPSAWREELLVYPKLALVGIIYLSIFKNRKIGLVYGLAFGLLQDMQFYGHMVGISSFTYAIAAYVAGLLVRPNLISLFLVFLVQISGLLLYELSLYALYRLFSVTDVDFAWAFVNGMLPSLLISLFLALALYIPIRKWLETPKSERDSDEE
ncbi:rod shape-determining protein MreD [Paenibacillus sp. TRM 82003]|nr:rod shape-determining protein MreD [Paenibacillus sp. TRM 82003]